MASFAEMVTGEFFNVVRGSTNRMSCDTVGKKVKSALGPSRRFAAMQQCVGDRGHADSGKPSTRQIYGFTA